MRKNEAKWIESRQRWQINIQSDGERRTFSDSTPGKKGKIACEKKSDEWIEKKLETNPRFDAAWKDFLAEKQATTGEANYIKLESLGRLWITSEMKRKRLSDITFQAWQNCVNAAGKAGKSKRTCVNIRAVITAFSLYAKKNRWKLEPPEFLTIPKNAPIGKRNILQPSDFKALFSEDTITHYGKTQKAFFIYAWRFIILLGLRRGELAGLANEDIEDGILHIQRSVNSLGIVTGGKTENAQRYIRLSQTAIDILADQRRSLADKSLISKWIFPNQDGSVMDTNSLYKHWRAYSEQHGIKSNLHELRHTFISTVKADMPEQLLKSMVGHSANMDTFRVYGHEVDGDRQRAANIVDEVFRKLI